MTLEKAIEIKEQHLRDNQPYDLPELEEAEKLLIEAGKRTMSNRDRVHPVIDRLLPGETKD